MCSTYSNLTFQDSIPEYLAISASIAAAGHAIALAILIGIQNVSEGIASYWEMMAGKTAFKSDPKKAFTGIGIVSVIPIFLGLVGLLYMQCTIEVIALDNPFNIWGIVLMYIVQF